MTTPVSTGSAASPWAEVSVAATEYRSPPTPTAPAMAELLIIATSTLPSGGMTMRTACGSTTRERVWPKVSPIDLAASAWPAGTALMPLRIASHTNAEVYRPRPIVPNQKYEPFKPTSGNPKAMKNSTTVSGQLRSTVTHEVPTARSGGSGDTRKAAMTVPTTRAITAA